MADGLNFTMGPFPPDAIEYASTITESSSEIAIPSVLISSIMLLGQIIWFRLNSRLETLEKGDLEPKSRWAAVVKGNIKPNSV
ncbi:uncharacterized protein LOC108051222 [Drosophila rhopaloa]|uniref:Uncharacterized protein LOC108051222 n=1 Tax=Drosophila rhopaloa TaxID=1041015 RepID=A0A6P4FU81_DRORH|nr:uncharacterized protein LOC108051222 [Drosophila rhopaloa]